MNKLNIGISLFLFINLMYLFDLFNYFIYVGNMICIMELISAYYNNNNINRLNIEFKLIYFTYIGCLSYISYYVLMEYSMRLLFNIVLIASISDICQYAIGYNYGTHYVSTISPKKTYEGYIAGVGSAILYSHFIQYTPIDMHLTLFEYTICFIYGALGDLISSYFKRQLSIKDWSYLLGKQGGVLDRGNSIVGIILYFITSYNKY